MALRIRVAREVALSPVLFACESRELFPGQDKRRLASNRKVKKNLREKIRSMKCEITAKQIYLERF